MEANPSATLVRANPEEVSRRAMLRRLGGGGLPAAGATLLPGSTAAEAIARQDTGEPTEAEVTALALRVVEAFNTGEVDRLDEVVADDVVGHIALPLPGRGKGLAGIKENILAVRTALPDAEVSVEDVLIQGNGVAARTTLRGTHEGELFGIPATGEQITVSGLTFGRVADGKFTEYWLELDALGALEQIGAFSLATAAAQATPAAVSAALDALIELPGVVLALEFAPDGGLVDRRSRLELPPEDLERAARYSAAASTAIAAAAGAYTELTGLRWDPPQWVVYSGGEWTTAIAGDRAIIAQTDQASFDQLFAALVGGQ